MSASKSKKPSGALVRSGAWLEDWERRYRKAEEAWENAKWARYEAQLREDKLGARVMMLRREFKAAKFSNDRTEAQP